MPILWVIAIVIIGGFFLLWLEDKLFRGVHTFVMGECIFDRLTFCVRTGLDGSGTFIFHRDSGTLILGLKTLTPDLTTDGEVNLTVEVRATSPKRLRHIPWFIPVAQFWPEKVIRVPQCVLPGRQSGRLVSTTSCGASMRALLETVKKAISENVPGGLEAGLDMWTTRPAGGHQVWGRFDDL